MTVKFMTVKGSENLGRTPFYIAGADLAPDATKLSNFPTFQLPTGSGHASRVALPAFLRSFATPLLLKGWHAKVAYGIIRGIKKKRGRDMAIKNLGWERFAGVLAAAMASAVASATTVEITKSFTYGYNFNSGECWEGGIAPQPGYDFRVANGYSFQVGYGTTGRDVTFSFPGDSLAFGIVDGTRGVFTHGGAADITINNMTLANGHYAPYYSWSYSSSSTLRGSAIIVSPESAPFEIRPVSSANHQGINCYMTISGEAGTGFLVNGSTSSSSGEFRLYASSPNYRGSIKVAYGNVTLGIATSGSLGGKLAAFKADAFVLGKRATLKSLAAGISLEASDNRGMLVESTGGRVLVPSGNDMTIGWPISGAGTLEKTGGGTLYVSNAVTVAAISLQEGCLAAAPGMTVEIPQLALAGGGLGAGVGCGIISATSLDMTEGAKIPVQIIGSVEAGRTMPFFKAPVGRYAVEDFQVAAGTGTYGEPFTKLTSAVDGAYEIFSLEVLPLVTTSASAVSGSYYSAQEGADWSDGRPVHEDAAYLVHAESADKTFRAYDNGTVSEPELEYDFPGHAITLAGSSTSARSRIYVRSRTFNGWLRFMDYSVLGFDDIPDPHVYRITGRIDVNANPSTYEGVSWSVHAGSTAIVESVVSGTGFIYLNNPYSQNTEGTIVLTGTNTYTGIISVYGGAKYVCLRIHDERNLGANPPAFDEMRLRLDTGSIFHPIGSVTIDDPNRGIRFGSMPTLRVDDGETLALGSPVSTYGSTVVTKTGGGTLDFSCPLAIASTFAIMVEGGFVKCGEAKKLMPAAVSFGEGCGIAMDRVTDASDERSMYGMVLTNAATTFPAAKLKVRIDHGGKMPRSSESVPFLTIPASLAASLGDRVDFVKNTPYGDWALVRDGVTIDGASFVRYSAKFLNGFKVMIR